MTLQLTGLSKPVALVTGMCSRLRLPKSLCENWALTRTTCSRREGSAGRSSLCPTLITKVTQDPAALSGSTIKGVATEIKEQRKLLKSSHRSTRCPQCGTSTSDGSNQLPARSVPRCSSYERKP